MQNYRLIRDPVLWSGVLLYALNRWLLRGLFPDSFFTRHLNDFLLIPIFSPLLVGCMETCKLRMHTGPPRGSEVLLPLIVTAFVFEVLHPFSPYFRTFSTADPRDVLWYVLGGIVATLIWQRYEPIHSDPTSDERQDVLLAPRRKSHDRSQ